MKTLTLRTLLWMNISLLLFSGCKDDENAVTPSDRIAGTWTLQSSSLDFTINDQDYVTFVNQIPGLSDEEKLFYIALIQLTIQEYEIPQGSTFEFKTDNTFEVKVPGETPETGTWSLSEDGTRLTIFEGTQDEIELVVESLTDNALILSFETVEEEDIDQDGEDDTLAGEITLNLSK